MSNVPKLRFREFSGDFDYDVLDELFKITSKKFDPSKTTEIKKCIELEHLSQETGNLLGYTNSNEQASIKNTFEKGQVLFGKLRPYLKKFWQANFDGVCSSEIWVLNGKKLTNSYLYHLVQTNKFNQVANVSSGSKMPRSDWQYMSQVPFGYPSKQEQEKIASFLTSLDTKIEQLIKKEQLLKEYKKGVMQKIFSQEIRFNADDGSEFEDWEEKTIGDIGKVSMCKRILKDQTTTDGDIPFYKIGTFGKEPDSYISNEVYNDYRNKYSFPKVGDILLSASGTIGRTVVYDGKPAYFQDSNIVWIDNHEELVLNNFLYYCYKIIKWTTEDTTIARLYNNNLRSMKINIPKSLEEQTKIANFLSSIDSKIEKVQKQLGLSKEFKKALLQQMFV